MPELLELLSVATASKIFRRRPRTRCGRTAEGSYFLYGTEREKKYDCFARLEFAERMANTLTHLFKYPGRLLLRMRTPCNDESLFSF